MKKLIALIAAAVAAPAFAATTYDIDASHSATSFAVKHLVVSTVRGQFDKTTGAIQYDEANPARSTVDATVDAASIDTRDPKRDEHLRSADFFDVAKYPTLSFRSTSVATAGKDKLEVKGDLTLHGVTRPVTLAVSATPAVKGMYGETRRAFSATTTIHRKDFGLTWNKAVEAGPVVGDDVIITLDIEGVERKPQTAAR
ncbi:MAG TPA: YceI family protein [Myxococcales bacterium]|nr:YceI family protein [Myxococcales bacterium]